MELRERDFILVDTETTGFDPVKHQILEVGILVVKDMKVTSELNIKIKHREYNISTQAMRTNGINDLIKHEKDALAIDEATSTILDFLENNKTEGSNKGYIFAGQNVKFDIGFLEALFKSCNKLDKYRELVSYRNLDLMQLALIKNLEGKIALDSLSLDSIIEAINLKKGSNFTWAKHTAYGDCKAEFMALQYLLSL